MWKENLPNHCPPNEAKEIKAEVYRILVEKIQTEKDFLPYAKLYPNNARYQSLCKAYSLSFYDTFNNAKKAVNEALTRGKGIGNYIGQYQLIESHGKTKYESTTGHFSVWLYKQWEVQNFNPSNVFEIGGN